MARIFSIFILLVTVGVLAADTVKESCYDEVEYNKNSVRENNSIINHII